MQGILPVTGGLILWFLGGWSVWLDYDVATENDFTMWTVPGLHWQVGGVFVIAFGAAIAGLIFFVTADHRARVLQEADSHPGHAHAGPRRVDAARGSARTSGGCRRQPLDEGRGCLRCHASAS